MDIETAPIRTEPSETQLTVMVGGSSTSTINPRKTNLEDISHEDESNTPTWQRHRRKLLTYEEMPAWYQDNEFIKHGYRPITYSTKACFASLLYLHNETVNIFTHLIPAFFFASAEALAAQHLASNHPKARAGDYAIFAVFLATATVTMLLFSTYHTMTNHSMRISDACLRADYLGILVLTLGDFVSGIYLTFFCEPALQKIYWAMVTTSPSFPMVAVTKFLTERVVVQILTLGSITSALVVHPRLQGLKWRVFRVGAFVGTSVSGLIPLAHGLIIHGWHRMWAGSGMPYYLLEGLCLLFRAFIYSTRIPESIWPGKFDMWGASHGIFHVLVVIATAIHFIGIWNAYGWLEKTEGSDGIGNMLGRVVFWLLKRKVVAL